MIKLSSRSLIYLNPWVNLKLMSSKDYHHLLELVIVLYSSHTLLNFTKGCCDFIMCWFLFNIDWFCRVAWSIDGKDDCSEEAAVPVAKKWKLVCQLCAQVPVPSSSGCRKKGDKPSQEWCKLTVDFDKDSVTKTTSHTDCSVKGFPLWEIRGLPGVTINS